MNEQRPTNPNQFQTPYAANPTAPAGQVVHGVGVTPSVVGVKPDARLANAFLSQAFLWMFAGLFVTAGVAYFVQSNASLLAFATRQRLPPVHGPARASSSGISGAINRISATAALGAVLRLCGDARDHDRATSSRCYTTGSVATAFFSASAMFGAAAVYGRVTQRSLAALRPHPVHGPHRARRRDDREHLPAAAARSPGSSRSSVSACSRR